MAVELLAAVTVVRGGTIGRLVVDNRLVVEDTPSDDVV